MNMVTKFAAVALLAAAPAVVAHADTITGTASLGSSGSFTSSSITFAAPQTVNGNQVNGSVTSASGTMASFFLSPALLNSFTFANVGTGAGQSPVTLFTAYGAAGSTLSFLITSLPTYFVDAQGSLNLAGSGIFSQLPGYTNTAGTFSLTSTRTGVLSFTISSMATVTPEPNSLLLLGTGLVGAATTIVRRRRMTA